MFKINMGGIVNQINSALETMTQLRTGRTSADFNTPGFNPNSGQTAALRAVTQTFVTAHDELKTNSSSKPKN